jgi:hypothetical protein
MNQPGLDGSVEKNAQQGSRLEALVDQQSDAALRNILHPGRIADFLAGYRLPKCAHVGGVSDPAASLGWGRRHGLASLGIGKSTDTTPYRIDRDSSSKRDKKIKFLENCGFLSFAEEKKPLSSVPVYARSVEEEAADRANGLKACRPMFVVSKKASMESEK